jgi:hypothetical protein
MTTTDASASDLTTEPTGVTEPTEPTGVTEPTEPTGVTEPTEPSTVTEPTEPSTVTEPTEPSTVTEPTKPNDEFKDWCNTVLDKCSHAHDQNDEYVKNANQMKVGNMNLFNSSYFLMCYIERLVKRALTGQEEAELELEYLDTNKFMKSVFWFLNPDNYHERWGSERNYRKGRTEDFLQDSLHLVIVEK